MNIYIVQKGDTLWKIAKKFGVSFDQLKRLNMHLANPDYIVPGMEIFLPDESKAEKESEKISPTPNVKERPITTPQPMPMPVQPPAQPPIQSPVQMEPPVQMPQPMPQPMPMPMPYPMPMPQPQSMPPVIMPYPQMEFNMNVEQHMSQSPMYTEPQMQPQPPMYTEPQMPPQPPMHTEPQMPPQPPMHTEPQMVPQPPMYTHPQMMPQPYPVMPQWGQGCNCMPQMMPMPQQMPYGPMPCGPMPEQMPFGPMPQQNNQQMPMMPFPSMEPTYDWPAPCESEQFEKRKCPDREQMHANYYDHLKEVEQGCYPCNPMPMPYSPMPPHNMA